MSADLFAAFDDNDASKSATGAAQSSGQGQNPAQRFSFFEDFSSPQSNTQPTPPSSHPGLGSINSLPPANNINPSQSLTARAPAQTADEPNNDDWGDFEDAEASGQQGAVNNQEGWGGLGELNGNSTAPSRASQSVRPSQSSIAQPAEDVFGWAATADSSRQTSASNQKVVTERPPRDPNVLFDAEEDYPEDEDEDDFGDFEDVEAVNPSKPAASSAVPASSKPSEVASTSHALDLLDLDSDNPGPSAFSPAVPSQISSSNAAILSPRNASFGQTAASPPLNKTPPPPKPKLSKPPEPELTITDTQDEDAWDDFTTWDTPSQPAAQAQPSTTTSDLPIISSLPIADAESPDESIPPANIPPPSLLLSLFPPLFAQAQMQLFGPLSTQPPDLRNQILHHPKTQVFLRGYLALLTVAARIIAGRKQRWKRDTLLSQSMRIGPAASGKSGGMKLTGVDKAETTKEDREVADVVRAWKEQIGRIRAAVAGAKTATTQIERQDWVVPELAHTMAVRTAKELEGGVPSKRPCALCGLKREERVGRVDVDVQDSFGEWWVEGWNGHRACRNFWEEHKEELRQR